MPIFSSPLGRVEDMSAEKGVKAIANHLRKLQEELEYRLMNLDSSNINEIDVEGTSVTVDGVDIQTMLNNTVSAVTVLAQTVSGLSSTVSSHTSGISGLDTRTDALESATAALDTRVDALDTLTAGHGTSIQANSDAAAQLAAAVQALEARVAALEGDNG